MALKVVTLNIWGLHLISKHLKERLPHIADELKKYDIVGLQEVWSKDDYKFLVGQVKDSLPYHFRFSSAIIGSGLCVFSRHPIMSVNALPFSSTGALRELLDGELFAGKGVMSCRIKTPYGPLLFVNTHINPRCRDSQMFEIAQLIGNSRGTDLVVLCGDFNTGENHPACRLMTTYLGLQDAFRGCNVNTCNLGSNVYTKKSKPKPSRVDFIFFSDERCLKSEMEVQSKGLAISGTIPGKEFPYSDHEGLEVVFRLKERTTPLVVSEQPLGGEAMSLLEEIAQRIQTRKNKFENTHRRIVGLGIGLVLFLFILSFLLGNHTVLSFLGTYYLSCLVTMAMALMGVGSLIVWLSAIFNMHHTSGMESNINEIRTELQYHRMQNDTSSSSYHLSV